MTIHSDKQKLSITLFCKRHIEAKYIHAGGVNLITLHSSQNQQLTVGAQSRRFSSLSIADLQSRLWIRFNVLKPSNAGWAYFGNLSIDTRDCVQTN